MAVRINYPPLNINVLTLQLKQLPGTYSTGDLIVLFSLLANHERPLDECGSRGGGAKTLHRARGGLQWFIQNRYVWLYVSEDVTVNVLSSVLTVWFMLPPSELMVTMGFPKDEITDSLQAQKYDDVMATYLLLGRKAPEVCLFVIFDITSS